MILQEPTNKWLKKFSQIGDRKFHKRYNSYLVEGVRLVEEAFIAAAPIQALVILKGYEKRGRIKALLTNAHKMGIPVYGVIKRDMERISRTENNQGIAASISYPSKIAGDYLGEMLQIENGLVLMLDGVQDPGNVGTIIRTADAFDIEGIILGPGSAGLYNGKTIRATMGSLFRLPIAEFQNRNSLDIALKFKEHGFAIISSDIGENPESIYNLSPKGKMLVIIGSEASGVSKGLLEISNHRLHIPMKGDAESLNAAIATGIILFHFSKFRD